MIAIGVTALIFKFALKKNFEDEFKRIVSELIIDEYQGEITDPKNAFTVAADIFQIYVSLRLLNNEYV